MAHCLLWYKQFRQDPGFCGISKAQQARVADYLDFVRELIEMGMDEDTILLNFSSTSFAQSGLKSLLPDSEIRKTAKSKIFDLISANKKVTVTMCRNITGINNWTHEFIGSNCKIGTISKHGKFSGGGVNHAGFFSTLQRGQTNKSGSYDPTRIKNIRGKINVIYKMNTSGQTNILENMISAGYGEDVYGAYCIALKWASERLEQEKVKPKEGM